MAKNITLKKQNTIGGETRKYKCPLGHVMKLDNKRVKKDEMNSCNQCNCDYEKAKDFLSCTRDSCDIDVCKDCRKNYFEDAVTCHNHHLCTMKGNVEFICDNCDQEKMTNFWGCEECDYASCVECQTENQVKCQFSHVLKFEASSLECKFCDSE
jgi:hypothetical protein